MDRLRRIPDWAWLALGLALRVAFALSLGGRTIQVDEAGFDGEAWNLAATHSLGPPGTTAPPLAPLFFSLFYLLGHYPVRARLAQAVLSTATAWVIGRATRDLTGSERAGRLALALSCVYPFFIYWSSVLMSETTYVALTAWAVWRLCRSLRGDGRAGDAALAGLALGLAALARPEGAYIWAVIWLAAAAACAARKWAWKAWAVAVLCWAIPILGWSARNQAATGRFALDIHGGGTMLHGTMFLDLNEVDTLLAGDAMERQPFYQAAQKLPPGERDKALMREAVRFMREHPGLTVRQWGLKFLNFWRFYPRTEKRYIETGISHPGAGLSHRGLAAISLCFEPWLIVLGIAGMALLARREWTLLPLPLFLLGTMGIHVISVSQMRYRMPVMPWLILSASWLIAERLLERPPEERPRTGP